jgi:hypothetical protein
MRNRSGLVRRSFAAVLVLAGAEIARAGDPQAPQQKQAFNPPDSITFRRVDIVSEGVRLTGEVFRPKDQRADAKLPAIVLCHG